jgi:hypothetical protein
MSEPNTPGTFSTPAAGTPPTGTPPTGTAATGSLPEQSTAPDYSGRPVAVRGPESLGGLLLILAGILAAISLIADWLKDDDISGWGLVRNGFHDLGGLSHSGLWQPLAIVLGGGVLFLLGLLLWLPMRRHRFFGLLALLVSLVVAAGVLVPLADAKWKLSFFGPGFYCAIAVAVLGLLGSLKALLTRKKYAR